MVRIPRDAIDASVRVRRQKAERLYREIVRLRMEEGKTNSEIASILGITIGTVYKKMGATPKRLGGKKHHDVAMIGRARYLRECGYTVDEIAQQTGVPRSTVGQWVRGMPCGY